MTPLRLRYIAPQVYTLHDCEGLAIVTHFDKKSWVDRRGMEVGKEGLGSAVLQYLLYPGKPLR